MPPEVPAPHPQDPSANSDHRFAVGLGLFTVLGGVAAVFGAYDDWYILGAIPVTWLMYFGAVFGVVVLASVVRALGIRGSVAAAAATLLATAPWFKRHKRVWLGIAVATSLLGGVLVWEHYNAPQTVIIEGVEDAPVIVVVEGEEPFKHTIAPGSRLEFSVPHGEHLIKLTCGERQSEHTVSFEGWRGDDRVFAAP